MCESMLVILLLPKLSENKLLDLKRIKRAKKPIFIMNYNDFLDNYIIIVRFNAIYLKKQLLKVYI